MRLFNLSILLAAWALSAAGFAKTPPAISEESFFVGGTYVGPQTAQVMQGQMYVQVLRPKRPTHQYPLVFIHGTGQTAKNWETTPDGREGWGQWFADHGWTVYLVDQPARGRSAWQPGFDPQPKALNAQIEEMLFTRPEDRMLWPQAKLHTQWPGGANKGRPGDPVFDQFFASQVASIPNADAERAMRAAGAALLDRIGPAILVVHSQAGLFGWLIADERPKLVKGIIALEPLGPPYRDAVVQTGYQRPYGLTATPLTYDPPVTKDDPLAVAQEATADGPDLSKCWLQTGDPRRLVNLADVAVLIVTTEASYHTVFDHCTAKYLTQAGVKNDFVRLGDHNIRGNAHMMMLEKNSLQIAAFLDGWLGQHLH